jgi:hypothetical protein
MTKQERLHLTMPPNTKEAIDEIQTRIGAGSMTEVIRRALSLLDTVTKEEKQGKRLLLRDKDGSEIEVKFI